MTSEDWEDGRPLEPPLGTVCVPVQVIVRVGALACLGMGTALDTSEPCSENMELNMRVMRSSKSPNKETTRASTLLDTSSMLGSASAARSA